MDFLIFLYLIIFPFGKLLGNATDLIVVLICILGIAKDRSFKIDNFVLICIFSLFFSLSFLNLPQILVGSMYLIRFISYATLSQIVWRQFGKTKRKKDLIFNSLIIVGIFVAIFGWIQYFFLPDLRVLKTLGWDDHYFRLVSTFLDPAFTGILLVLTEVLILIKTVKSKTNFNLLLNIFLILTILFTYSRASYLSLIGVLIFLLFKFREKFILFLLILFVLLIPILPRQSGGEGVNLTRTYSIVGRFVNYQDSIKLIEKSPIFGVGFNNVCVATNRDASLHSCSGLDNSILFIVATTGIVGIIIFIDSMLRIVKTTKRNTFGTALFVSLIAIFIHGMFTETFFYSFVLGWMAILIGITRKEVKG